MKLRRRLKKVIEYLFIRIEESPLIITIENMFLGFVG